MTGEEVVKRIEELSIESGYPTFDKFRNERVRMGWMKPGRQDISEEVKNQVRAIVKDMMETPGLLDDTYRRKGKENAFSEEEKRKWFDTIFVSVKRVDLLVSESGSSESEIKFFFHTEIVRYKIEKLSKLLEETTE